MIPFVIGIIVFALVLLLGRKRRVKTSRDIFVEIRGMLRRHIDERGYPLD